MRERTVGIGRPDFGAGVPGDYGEREAAAYSVERPVVGIGTAGPAPRNLRGSRKWRGVIFGKADRFAVQCRDASM